MKAEELRPYFATVGYRDEFMRSSVRLPTGERRGLFGFSRYPYDARSACFAAIDVEASGPDFVRPFRDLGAPIVFLCTDSGIEWWDQKATPERRQEIAGDKVAQFFEVQASRFSPSRIHLAKTDGRWDRNQQLTFVDIGLMPLAEYEMGERVSGLIERCLAGIRIAHKDAAPDSPLLRERLRQIFWLVGAKILRDKEVAGFQGLRIADVGNALKAVAAHYQSTTPYTFSDSKSLRELEASADEIERFSNLSLLTTESLAFIYENAGVSPETRRTLGTHSTPFYLVDYLVGRMRDWIEAIEPNDRIVFEPACGHAPFLVAASRLLTDAAGDKTESPEARHAYLKRCLHGADIDPFALEIARLALTLTDIPNPDGWDLVRSDIFAPDFLSKHVARARIVLANPPYEKFSAVRQDESSDTTWEHPNMAQALADSVIRNLPPGGLMGLILPAHFLHESASENTRRSLLENFEVREIGLLPDNVFEYSSNESCLILAKRKTAESKARTTIHFGRVRENGVESFRDDYRYESTEEIEPEELKERPGFSLRLPRLWPVWKYLESLPTLGDFGEIGQGLTHFGRANLPSGTPTFETFQFEGAVQGFWSVGRKTFTHLLPEARWINLDASTIRRALHGTRIESPQILFNKSPTSRGPWRLTACIDKTGTPFLSRLFCFRPSEVDPPLEYWWALFNSPIFNAFAFSFFGKRDMEKSGLLKIPVPAWDASAGSAIIDAAKAYRKATLHVENIADQHRELQKLRILHDRMDAAVLEAYQLPASLERDLLKLFSEEKRGGVPFSFDTYIPDYFSSPIRLRELLEITEDWEVTNERRCRLIDLFELRDLSPDEQSELNRYQHLADLQVEYDAMPDLLRLRHLEDDLKDQGILG